MQESLSPGASAPLSQWQSYLESLHTCAIDLGLERVSRVAENAKLTKPAPNIITVAGTNGKGSTCAIIEAILLQAGYKTGVYSSPHLCRYNERVRINGQELEDKDHTKAFSDIEAMRGNINLSFFEFTTLATLKLFIDHQVDVAILEVGLGGRLDATNVVDPDVAVITSLAIDHIDWLGDDIEEIGYAKAGIYRHDKPAICGQPTPPASVSAYADEIGANFYQIGYQYHYRVQNDVWHWNCGAFDLQNLPIPALPLANAATALMALGVSNFEVSDEHIVAGLKAARLAGRMEVVAQSPLVIFDVAHNPHSACYLAEQLTKLKKDNAKVHAVVGMLKDKDISATLAMMNEVVDCWYPASLDEPRGANAQQLLLYLPQATQGFDFSIDAYHAAIEATKGTDDIVIAFGSFYTIGQLTDYLSKME